jgi:hypothetical protein
MNKTIHVLHDSNVHQVQDALDHRRNVTTDHSEDLRGFNLQPSTFPPSTFPPSTFNVHRLNQIDVVEPAADRFNPTDAQPMPVR